jgi:hypothetical protein
LTLSSSAVLFLLILASTISLLLIVVVDAAFNQIQSATAQNNSNMSLSTQLSNSINMSNFTKTNANATSAADTNMTDIMNITGISNATSGEPIPLQQIVTLKNTVSDSELNAIVNDVKNKGAEVLFTYKEVIKGFAFRAPDSQVLQEIVSSLQNNPSVESVIPDKTVGIM